MVNSKIVRLNFEIATTAVIAAAVFAIPDHSISFYSLFTAIAVSLPVTALLRRVIFEEKNTKAGYFYHFSTAHIHLGTSLLALYLIFYVTELFESSIGISLNTPVFFLLLSLMLAVGVILVIEFTEIVLIEHGQRVLLDASEGLEQTGLGKLYIGFASRIQSIINPDRPLYYQLRLYHYTTDSSGFVDEILKHQDFLMNNIRENKARYIYRFVWFYYPILTLPIFVFIGIELFSGTIIQHVMIYLSITPAAGLFALWYTKNGFMDFTNTNPRITFTYRGISYILLSGILLI